VIRGRVVDRTPPVHPAAGQLVRLQIVERGASSERETRSGADGAFEFTGLPVGGLRVFLVSTEYQGASYKGAQRIILTPDAPARRAPLAVYDAGVDRGALRGTLLFAVVDVVPGAVRVTTVEQVQNGSDRTIVPTRADPLAFPLPREAVEVQALDGWQDPRVEDDRIADTRAVAPGVMQAGMAEASIASGKYERYLREDVIPRYGKAADIARAVRFLLEPDSYVTGQVLSVDGGITL
jgi:hypothetical protein